MRSTALAVFVGGQRVGTLQRQGGRIALRFSQEWRERADRFVLSAQYEETNNADPPRPTLRLPPYFANLAFEGRLREWVARSEGLTDDSIEFLGRVGLDLPGAVQLRPISPESGLVLPTDADEPINAIGPRGEPRSGALRWSLAGVQLKASVAPSGDRFTVPVHGQLGSFIAKFADQVYTGVPVIEHATMQWCAASGLGCAETSLRKVSDISDLPFDGPSSSEPVLLVRRFDRTRDGAAAVHAEEFAQALGIWPDEKYDRFGWKHQLRLVANLCPIDVGEYLRRLVFVILSGNSDAHHKNWGLIYPDGRKARLSPAYDQVATVMWSGPGSKLADTLPYKLHGSRRYETVSLGSLTQLLASAGLARFRDGERMVEASAARSWFREVAQQILDARRVADASGGARLRLALDRHLARLPLVKER